MRVLLLGARGMLGRELAASAPPGVVVIDPGHPRLDITSRAAIESALGAHRPDLIVNAAAYTRVDDAEREPAAAMAVNAEAVGLLGRAARSRGIGVVHFGSDYVFSGDSGRPYAEDDATGPLNRYGESKRAGELALLESGARALVVRTQWLFGIHGRSLPRTMWERARAGLPSRVVNDQVGRPTYAPDLAHAVWRLLAADALGIVHATNAGTATWYDVARAVYASEGRAPLVTPCSTAEFPTPARRPAFSVLATGRLESMLGAPLPAWEDALERFLAQLRDGPTATVAK